MLEALDGERLCKLGHYTDAVLCFERALNAESQEIELLIAIYSQLGNCHFCLKDYSKSFDWHKCALDLSWLVLRDCSKQFHAGLYASIIHFCTH